MSNTVSINGFLNCTDKERNRWEIITSTENGLFALPVAYENGLLFDDMRDSTNRVVLTGDVMFCRNGRLSVRFCGGEIDILGNRKQLKRGERVRIEGRLVSKIYRTGVYQKIEADEVMRI